jgi:hypothetical protein
MNKNIILRTFSHYSWGVAEVEIYTDGALSKTVKINRFYDVNDGFINIYETVGGSGTGYQKGNLTHRIVIDCDFETIEGMTKTNG